MRAKRRRGFVARSGWFMIGNKGDGKEQITISIITPSADPKTLADRWSERLHKERMRRWEESGGC